MTLPRKASMRRKQPRLKRQENPTAPTAPCQKMRTRTKSRNSPKWMPISQRESVGFVRKQKFRSFVKNCGTFEI